MARRARDVSFSLKTAITDTSNLDRLPKHSIKFLLAFFKILPQAINRLALATWVQLYLKDIYRLCAVREIVSDAPLSPLVSWWIHQLNDRNPRRRSCSSNHMMPHTFTTWPPALRCHKLSSTLSSDQQNQIDNKCCFPRPLPPPSLPAKCFQNRKRKLFKWLGCSLLCSECFQTDPVKHKSVKLNTKSSGIEGFWI